MFIQGGIEQLALTDDPLAASQQCSTQTDDDDEDDDDIVSILSPYDFKCILRNRWPFSYLN